MGTTGGDGVQKGKLFPSCKLFSPDKLPGCFRTGRGPSLLKNSLLFPFKFFIGKVPLLLQEHQTFEEREAFD